MWQRHGRATPPSHYAIHNACTQILPLVEMYCRWELEEDCSDLHSLMCRFDCEAELESHELGRSLLTMVRDDSLCLERLPPEPPVVTPTNLFDVLRERLAAADLAIRDLQPQVQPFFFFLGGNLWCMWCVLRNCRPQSQFCAHSHILTFEELFLQGLQPFVCTVHALFVSNLMLLWGPHSCPHCHTYLNSSVHTQFVAIQNFFSFTIAMGFHGQRFTQAALWFHPHTKNHVYVRILQFLNVSH